MLPTGDDVARVASDRIVAGLARGIAERGVANIALTGGSSCVPLYRELGQPARRAQLDWQHVHLWWGDERLVPLDNPESNAGLANRLLLAAAPMSGAAGDGGQATDVEAGALPGLIIDPRHVHPVPVDEALGAPDAPGRAAAAYAAEIERLLPHTAEGTPVFDLILSGIGPDGHLMSVFPGSPALAPDAPIAMGIPAPEHVEPHLPRVTLSTRLLPAAHEVLVMAFGARKRDIIAAVLGARRDARQWPVQSALLANALWLIDREAAGL